MIVVEAFLVLRVTLTVSFFSSIGLLVRGIVLSKVVCCREKDWSSLTCAILRLECFRRTEAAVVCLFGFIEVIL